MERNIQPTGESDRQAADTWFIEDAVEFIRIYADRCHHGKEEEILFRKLDKKTLSVETLL